MTSILTIQSVAGNHNDPDEARQVQTADASPSWNHLLGSPRKRLPFTRSQCQHLPWKSLLKRERAEGTGGLSGV